MEERSITFPSRDLRLEGCLAVPAGATRGTVVCHPHPQYGGSMDVPVVFALARFLRRAGVATLRFNFRGVGASQGGYAGGSGEAEDARAAVGFLAGEAGVATVTLAGYSFGAIMALVAGHDHETVASLVAIAPPVTMFDIGFLAACRKPKLFVLGDEDQYCGLADLERLVSALRQPKKLVRLEGADHFLSGFEDAIGQHVVEFLKGEAP